MSKLIAFLNCFLIENQRYSIYNNKKREKAANFHIKEAGTSEEPELGVLALFCFTSPYHALDQTPLLIQYTYICCFSIPFLFFFFQGVWEMESEQLGSGKERFLGVSITSDSWVHQEHSTLGPQAHHPDDHWQSDQEVWDSLLVVSDTRR